MADDTAKKHFAQTADINVIRSQLSEERIQRITEAARNRQRGLTLLLEDVWDPHNLAAITRTADAFGLQQIHYTTSQDFDPDDLGFKSGKRAHKWVDYTHHDNVKSCITDFRREGWYTVVTALSDEAISVFEVDWATFNKVVIVVGNEHRGISEDTLKLADAHITIPMLGMMQSLNVSVATAIILAEITRQRQASEHNFTLPDDEVTHLIEDFLRRAIF